MRVGFFNRQTLRGTPLSCNSFFYDGFYVALTAFVTAFCYCLNIPLVGLIYYVCCACCILLRSRDLTPLLSTPMMVVLMLRDFNAFSSPITYVIISPAALCIIAHFILYPIKKFKFGKLFFPLLAISVAMLLGGIASPYFEDYSRGLVSSLTVGPLVLIIYLLFLQYCEPPENFNLEKYICTILTTIGILIFIEVLHFRYSEGYADIGWGNINNSASLLLICIPACWYNTIYTKHTIVNLIALDILYLTMLMTGSSGAIGTAFAFVPIIILTVLLSGELKDYKFRILKILTILFSIFLALFVVLVLLNHKVPNLLNIFDVVANDTSRSVMYLEAIKLFKQFPLFGVGLGYVSASSTLDLNNLQLYNFHSFIFHVMATTGLIGIIAFTYYFATRYKLVTEKSTPFNITAFFSLCMFQVYAAVDTGEFNVIPLLICLTLLLVVVEKCNKRTEHEPLSLLIHHRKNPF